MFSSAYDLIRHNLVVFRGGQGALQILPKLVDVIPEARFNLIIYYLQQVYFFLVKLLVTSSLSEQINLRNPCFVTGRRDQCIHADQRNQNKGNSGKNPLRHRQPLAQL